MSSSVRAEGSIDVAMIEPDVATPLARSSVWCQPKGRRAPSMLRVAAGPSASCSEGDPNGASTHRGRSHPRCFGGRGGGYGPRGAHQALKPCRDRHLALDTLGQQNAPDARRPLSGLALWALRLNRRLHHCGVSVLDEALNLSVSHCIDMSEG